jgi:alpha-tubulin suppressor-like RCC1 family protein
MLGWGVNAHGQLGLGPSSVTSFIPTPQSIPFFADHMCIQVACSLTHALFLLHDGSIYSAGSNEYSQLGREGRSSIPGWIVFARMSSIDVDVHSRKSDITSERGCIANCMRPKLFPVFNCRRKNCHMGFIER